MYPSGNRSQAIKRRASSPRGEHRIFLALFLQVSVYMTLQLLAFQNEFRSRVKFVLHSHDKIKWLSLRRSRLYACATCPGLHDLRFSIRNKVRVQLDLLASRAFERVARLWARSASERKLVPGPTTPDQKTKRTTLRKSSVQFTWYQDKNFVPEQEFYSEWKPGWTHCGMTCTGTKCRLGIT